MRHIFLILFILLIPIATAQEMTRGSALIIESQKSALTVGSEIHSYDMQAAIDVAKEKNLNFAALESIKNEFSTEKSKIENSTDKASFNEIEDSLQNIAQNFRDKAKEIGIRAYLDDLESKKNQLKETNKQELDKLKDNALESRKIALITIFDTNVENLENAVKLASLENSSMEKINFEIYEFKILKQELVNTVNSKDKNQTETIKQKIKDSWKKIKEDIESAQEEDSIKMAAEKGMEISAKTKKNILILSEAKINTGAIQSRLTLFDKDLNASITGTTLEDKRAGIRNAQNDLADLKITYDQLRTGKK